MLHIWRINDNADNFDFNAEPDHVLGPGVVGAPVIVDRPAVLIVGRSVLATPVQARYPRLVADRRFTPWSFESTRFSSAQLAIGYDESGVARIANIGRYETSVRLQEWGDRGKGIHFTARQDLDILDGDRVPLASTVWLKAGSSRPVRLAMLNTSLPLPQPVAREGTRTLEVEDPAAWPTAPSEEDALVYLAKQFLRFPADVEVPSPPEITATKLPGDLVHRVKSGKDELVKRYKPVGLDVTKGNAFDHIRAAGNCTLLLMSEILEATTRFLNEPRPGEASNYDTKKRYARALAGRTHTRDVVRPAAAAFEFLETHMDGHA